MKLSEQAGKKDSFVLLTFTFLTPNYLFVHLLNTILRLNSAGYKVVVVLLDSNILSYRPARSEITDFDSEEDYLNHKEREFISIAEDFGIRKEDLIVLRGSKLWVKFTSFSNPPLFNYLHKLLVDLKLGEIQNIEKKIRTQSLSLTSDAI
ncbi:MAG: hypothetical protein ACLFNK_04540 [Candidatus Woesearchaeota archaeon]